MMNVGLYTDWQLMKHIEIAYMAFVVDKVTDTHTSYIATTK